MPLLPKLDFLARFLPLCWFGICPVCKPKQAFYDAPADPPDRWDRAWQDAARDAERMRAGLDPLLHERPRRVSRAKQLEHIIRVRYTQAALNALPLARDSDGEPVMTRELFEIHGRVVEALRAVEVSDLVA